MGGYLNLSRKSFFDFEICPVGAPFAHFNMENDPNVVDLSGLKDSYSAKVNSLELKSPTQTNTSKEKCQEALDYATNRIRALNQMINNSGKLIEQQNKTIATAENEVRKLV